MVVNHGSSNLNYHMELTKQILVTKISLDIELEMTLLHIVQTVLVSTLSSEIIMLLLQMQLKFQIPQMS